MSTFGKNIIVSLFGESHGKTIGITMHHLPSGIELDIEKMKRKLLLRKGLKEISTARNELDEFEIVSGFFNNHTTGAPLTVLIHNNDTRSHDYAKTKDLPRPSHADYTSYCKYNGFNDYRGGGHFSGRLTALIVILGSICEDILVSKNVKVLSRIKSIYNIEDTKELTFDLNLENQELPVVDETVKEKMLEVIKKAKASLDSVGGVIETKIFNVPVGAGEPFFDSFESVLSHLLFSIPGVKGVEFGGGFEMTKMYGSECNDQMTVEDNSIHYYSNYSGGINGGITNGDIVSFRTAMKPTPSISRSQKTFNMQTKENEELVITGRHDPVICIKGLHVVNAMAYYCVLEMLMESRLWD